MRTQMPRKGRKRIAGRAIIAQRTDFCKTFARLQNVLGKRQAAVDAAAAEVIGVSGFTVGQARKGYIHLKPRYVEKLAGALKAKGTRLEDCDPWVMAAPGAKPETPVPETEKKRSTAPRRSRRAPAQPATKQPKALSGKNMAVIVLPKGARISRIFAGFRVCFVEAELD